MQPTCQICSLIDSMTHKVLRSDSRTLICIRFYILALNPMMQILGFILGLAKLLLLKRL
jgi:hypothetical protein